MTTTGKTVKVAFTSDWHLGNTRVRPEHMIRGLNSTITNELLSKIDILFLGGDVWDKGLTLPAIEVPSIFIYISTLLKRCKKFNVKLRIVEGTGSHDRKQSVYFKVINEVLGEPCDLRYYPELCIDTEEDLDLKILYVPDEWKHSTDKAWDDVLAELKKHDIEQVDFAIMHGSFKYQMPEEYGLNSHDEERYLKIVKRYISIGHIHKYSRHEHIIAQGSHDRIAHNEDEMKGLVYVESNPGRVGDKVQFIENKLAMPFVTVELKGLEPDKVAQAIDRTLQDLIHQPAANDFYLRVSSPESEINRSIYDQFVKEYPDINWAYKTEKKKKKKPKSETRSLRHASVVINQQTVREQIKAKLEEQKAKGIEESLSELGKLVA